MKITVNLHPCGSSVTFCPDKTFFIAGLTILKKVRFLFFSNTDASVSVGAFARLVFLSAFPTLLFLPSRLFAL